MVSVALVIALARSVAVIMGETQLDTFILTNAANALSGVPAFIFAPATFLFYFVLVVRHPLELRHGPRWRCPSWGR